MDMTGLRKIKAIDLKPGNIVCFEDWTNDFKVVDAKCNGKKVEIFASNLLEIATKNVEYDCDDDIVILKV